MAKRAERKTIEVRWLVVTVNNRLKRSPDGDTQGRRALIALLEDALLRSGHTTWHYYIGRNGEPVFREEDAPDPTRRVYTGGARG